MKEPFDFNAALERATTELSSVFGEKYGNMMQHDLVLAQLLKHSGFNPTTIFDVGGSDGIWSAITARVFPGAHYEIFEPLTGHSDEYREGVEAGALAKFHASKKARVHPVALGRSSGTCTMTVYPGSVGSTALPLEHRPPNTRMIEVPCQRLDDFLAESGLRPPDLLKLDTQGTELDILKGAEKSLDSISAILCECWLIPGYGPRTPLWIEIAKFLEPYGFALFDFGTVYRKPDGLTGTVDMLFLKADRPASPLHVITPDPNLVAAKEKIIKLKNRVAKLKAALEREKGNKFWPKLKRSIRKRLHRSS